MLATYAAASRHSAMEPLRKRRKVKASEKQSTVSSSGSQLLVGPATWSILPVLVLMKVLFLLDSPEDRRSVRLVCLHWSRCMNDWPLWRHSLVYITTGCLQTPELTLLNARKIHRLSFGPLPPSKLLAILKKLWYVLPWLEHLSIELQRKRVKEYNLQSLSQLKNLRNLAVGGGLVPVKIPILPALKVLKIRGEIQPRFQYSYSLEYGNLEWLIFEGVVICRNVCHIHVFIESFPRLVGVRVANTNLICGARVFFTPFLPYPLQVLHLSHCTLLSLDLRFLLGGLQSLHTLSLEGTECCGDVTTGIFDMVSSQLTTLSLQRCNLTDCLDLRRLLLSLFPNCLHHLNLADCVGAAEWNLWDVEHLLPGLVTLNLTGWELNSYTRAKLEDCNIKIIT